MMEAAGIEPASRNTSAWASTCVFGLFKSESAADRPTAHRRTEPGLVSPVRRQAFPARTGGSRFAPGARASLLMAPVPASRRRGADGLP
jgi:hypothetical protein